MTYQYLALHEQTGTLRITLLQPQINKAMINELQKALEYADDSVDIAYIVLQGQNGVFSQGLNYRQFSEQKHMETVDFNRWEKLLNYLQKIDKTTLATIAGDCYGAGIQLALCCDVRLATPDSQFAHTELACGYLPGTSILQLGKYCGVGRALELIQNGEHYPAELAVRMGIVNQVSEHIEIALVGKIQQYGKLNPKLRHMTRRLVHEAFEMQYEDFLGCCQAAQHQAVIQLSAR